MQEKNKKKKWDKPMLLILTRGKPEEGCLLSCKCHITGRPPWYGPIGSCDTTGYPAGSCVTNAVS